MSHLIDLASLAFGSYSLTERDTGFKWIDGRSIYKKSFNMGTLPNATEKAVPHGIANFSRAILLEGYAYRATDNTNFILPYVTTNTSGSQITLLCTNTSILIGTGIDRTNTTECYATMYYLKTT